MLSIRFFTALLAAAASALPTESNVFEALPAVPQGWKVVGKPAPDTLLTFKIALSPQHVGLFEETLYKIADPAHAEYGKHLGQQQIIKLLQPAKRATQAVLSWLIDRGVAISDIKDDGEWVAFSTNASHAEALLDTEFHTYKNQYGSFERIRTLSYSIPRELHQYVDLIQPTTRFAQIKPQMSHVLDVKPLGSMTTNSRVSALNVTSCNKTITPTCLRELYRVPLDNGLKNESVGFAAFNNFLDEVPRYSDLAQFANSTAPYISGESFPLVSINGGSVDQASTADSVEANLDAQYIISMGYPVPITAYATAGRGPIVPDLDQPDAATAQNEPYLDFLNYLLKQPDHELPHTLSTSYGEDEQSVPLSYRLKVCQLFGQLGARGVSVIFSSGDTGVGSACQTNDGKNVTRFLPIFPAACPFVTSVGGTHYVKPEQAVSFSSGGFSDTWPQPEYQKAAVAKYLQGLGSTWKGLYNASGRGFPDVAAQARNFVVIDKGSSRLVGGTSASAPTFAGIISVLNGLRIQHGKPGLGFLNPWIYSIAHNALNDITVGGSTGCTGTDIYSGLKTPYVPGASWNATKGWDPVTGYGTPDFEKLKHLALLL